MGALLAGVNETLLCETMTRLSSDLRRASSLPAASSLISLPAASPSPATPAGNATQDGDVCPICLESSSLQRSLRCGHRFCRECIQQWLDASSDCPMCRRRAEPVRGAIRAAVSFARKWGPPLVFHLVLVQMGSTVGLQIRTWLAGHGMAGVLLGVVGAVLLTVITLMATVAAALLAIDHELLAEDALRGAQVVGR